MKAMRIHQYGGPEVLQWEELPVPVPGSGEVLVANEAIGLNFIDIYYRTGRYPAALPFIPGHEGAGVVIAVGPDVQAFKVGDRVGYVDPMGSYAQQLVRPADRLIAMPDHISCRQAAAMLLKGMTAEYLLQRTYRVQRGDVVLIHAAAGGVGQILCQWAKHLGATVIGTVGRAHKRDIARAVGCDHVLVLGETPDFVQEVRRLTNGKGVPVVYDSVGLTTFLQSLDCLSPFGMMVIYGASSGAVPPFDVQMLAGRGSLYVTRPALATYTSTPEMLQASARALFDVMATGNIKVDIGQCYALEDAAEAHRALESRALTGSTLLLA